MEICKGSCGGCGIGQYSSSHIKSPGKESRSVGLSVRNESVENKWRSSKMALSWRCCVKDRLQKVYPRIPLQQKLCIGSHHCIPLDHTLDPNESVWTTEIKLDRYGFKQS